VVFQVVPRLLRQIEKRAIAAWCQLFYANASRTSYKKAWEATDHALRRLERVLLISIYRRPQADEGAEEVQENE